MNVDSNKTIAAQLTEGAIPGVKLFGSHLMGTNTASSDIDFIAGVDEKDLSNLTNLIVALLEFGFVDATPTKSSAWKKRAFGEPEEDYTTDEKGDVDPTVLGIFKRYGTGPFDPCIDVIVVSKEEASRRLRTLTLIAQIGKNDPEVGHFMRSQMKKNHKAWRTLHKLVDAAYYEGLRCL